MSQQHPNLFLFISHSSIVYKCLVFLLPLSLSPTMMNVCCSDLCRFAGVSVYLRVPENAPENWDIVICPINKLLAASLVCGQLLPNCQLEIPQTTLRHGWRIRNFQRHTLFHWMPFACSCLVWKADKTLLAQATHRVPDAFNGWEIF